MREPARECRALALEIFTAARRESEQFEIHVISFDAFTVDGVRKLEDVSVTNVTLGFRIPYETDNIFPLGQKIDELRSFADNVIAKVG